MTLRTGITKRSSGKVGGITARVRVRDSNSMTQPKQIDRLRHSTSRRLVEASLVQTALATKQPGHLHCSRRTHEAPESHV
jgi:hypothetical protein